MGIYMKGTRTGTPNMIATLKKVRETKTYEPGLLPEHLTHSKAVDVGYPP